jgi:hypothetical protein
MLSKDYLTKIILAISLYSKELSKSDARNVIKELSEIIWRDALPTYPAFP